MRVATALAWLATLLYPLAIWLGLARFEPRWLGGVLLAVALLRAIVSREPVWLLAALGALVLVVVAWLGNDGLPLKLYPVLVNAVLLAVFAFSLWRPPTVIERLARLRHPDLPPDGVRWVTGVTRVWCGFFVLNGGLALWTALNASDAGWALYNGAIAYVLIGALLAGEWWLRPRHDH
ncbi:MAG: hypothetical protein EOP93_14250 [Lysobacteraceae bacterium]|nr:MAG: hypothetical protein EOP93_14250 [Xanthomonadaceae bacterium]